MSDNDFDLMDGLGDLENAAAKQAKSHFGLFDIKFRPYRKGAFKEVVLRSEYDEAVKAGRKDEFGSEYVVTLAESEMGADKDYRRGVNLKGPDMKNVFIPSVRKLMNKPEATLEEVLSFLVKLRGHYLRIDDTPQTNWDGTEQAGDADGKQWSTARFIAILSSKEEAAALYAERWGKKNATTSASNGTAITTPTAPAEPEMTCPPDEKPNIWKRAIPKIKARVKDGESVEVIAKAYEVDVEYIEQFVTGIPVSVGVPE